MGIFERQYDAARVETGAKLLQWAGGNMTFSIYEELVNQTNLFHKALIDFGFPVRCSPFDDPVTFHIFSTAYHENQSQLSEAINGGQGTSPDELRVTTLPQDGAKLEPASISNSDPVLSTPFSPLMAKRAKAHIIHGHHGSMAQSTSAIHHPYEGSNPIGHLHRSYAVANLNIPQLANNTASSSNPGTATATTPATTPNSANSAKPISPSSSGAHFQRDTLSTSPVLFTNTLSPTQVPPNPWESANKESKVAQEIEFGSSLASKYKEALKEHQELQTKYRELEENFLELSNDAAEANTSLQYFEEQYKESVQNYDTLLREYDAVKRTVGDNEEAMQVLAQTVTALEAKLQKLQRITQRSFTTQLLWYIILLLLYILLLPALGVTFLWDLYRSKYQEIEINEENSLRFRLSRYSKLQLVKLERVIDTLERKVLKATGLDTKQIADPKEKRS